MMSVKVMIDKVQEQYEMAVEALKMISRNLDFAQMKIKAGLRVRKISDLSHSSQLCDKNKRSRH
jgi:hypothetical protein